MRRRQTILAAAALGTVIATGAGIVAANGSERNGRHDAPVPISGADLERASAAALAQTGEGRVTNTEVSDEESHYEVEVTLPDGSQLDVQLDEGFNVVRATPDRDAVSGGG